MVQLEGDRVALRCAVCRWSSEEAGLVGSLPELEAAVKGRAEGAELRLQALVAAYQYHAREELRLVEQVRAVPAADGAEAGASRPVQSRQTLTQAKYRKRVYTRFSAYNRSVKPISRAQLREHFRSREGKRYDDTRHEWVAEEDAGVDPLRAPARAPPALPADVFTASRHVGEITTLEQRLRDPAAQPDEMSRLVPQFTQLMAKRGKRCRESQHNLIRHELNPSSVKFKMQLFATLNVPSLRIATLPALRAGEEAQVVLMLSNPTDQALEVQLLAAEPSSAAAAAPEPPAAAAAGGAAAPGGHMSPLRVSAHPPPPPNAEIRVPPVALVIGEHDPVQDYMAEDEAAKAKYDDDPAVIHRRAANTVQFYVGVTPKEESPSVTVAVRLAYKYKSAVLGLRGADATRRAEALHDVELDVRLELGPTERLHDSNPFAAD